MKFKNTSGKKQHIESSKGDVFLMPGDEKTVDEKTVSKAELERAKKVLTVMESKAKTENPKKSSVFKKGGDSKKKEE